MKKMEKVDYFVFINFDMIECTLSFAELQVAILE